MKGAPCIKKRISRGFTLIELLVVVAIIGLLASVILAALGSAQEKARDAKRISDVKQIQLALELYHGNKGQYPSNPANTRVENMNTGSANIAPYINPIPTDPTNTRSSGYRYRQSNINDRQSYTLLIRLEANDGNWCSVSMKPGYSSWNGIDADGGGSTDGVPNYPPCF